MIHFMNIGLINIAQDRINVGQLCKCISIVMSVFLVAAGLANTGGCDDGVEWVKNTSKALHRIEEVTRKNFERVQTWRGRFRYQSYDLYEGEAALQLASRLAPGKKVDIPFVYVTSGFHDFAVNVPKSSFFCRSVQDDLPQFRNLISGANLDFRAGLHSVTEVVTPEKTLLVDPVRRRSRIEGFPDLGDSSENCSMGEVIATESTEIRGWGGNFDARKVFGYNEPIWMEIGAMASGVEKITAEYLKEAMAGLSVDEIPNGDHVDLVYEKRPKGRRVKIVFSGAVGHCPVSYAVYRRVESSGNEPGEEYLSELQTWDYVQEGDIFLPGRVVRKQMKPDGTLFNEYGLRVESSELNVDLGPNAFTYKWLALKDGDHLFDETAYKLFRMNGGSLVEIPPTLGGGISGVNSQRPVSSGFRTAVFILLNFVVVASVLFFIIWRRLRPTNRTS